MLLNKGVNVSFTVVEIKDEQGLRRCFPAFKELRPKLEKEAFVKQVQRQYQQGYCVVAIEELEEETHSTEASYPSVLGFRFIENLAWGKIIYIDDLATISGHRGQGFAPALLDWIIELAQNQHCDAVHLDSGYARNAAHKVYLNKGFILSSHHFSCDLRSQAKALV
ncbi:GNAT family N-acetyltransferase [Agaribacterium sp. ZY112]|uniref:GNAT family N-acetyltransferase n=1 Tax=Agaribacterium sp. ZY112 TaxID=3233574 RepID=UPI00352446B6